MSIRFGVSPIAWSNDDMPELGGDTPLDSILADIRDVGFKGVELGGRFPRDAGELQPLLQGYGLDLIGGWYSGALLERDAQAEIAAMQPYLQLLEAMGSTAVVFAETSNAVHGRRDVPLTGTPLLAEEDWAGFGMRMTEVAEHVRGRGLRFAYHHHLGTVSSAAKTWTRCCATPAKRSGSRSTPAMRPWAASITSRSSASIRRASPTCTARTCAAPPSSACARMAPASWTACSPACSPCPATATSTTARRCRR